MSISYQSITSIMAWADVRVVEYLWGDRNLPYVKKDGLFWYFGREGNGYALKMTSLNDLGEQA